MKNVNMYTDGACSGNPGKGGFGIMADDLLSGVYATIVMLVFNYFV